MSPSQIPVPAVRPSAEISSMWAGPRSGAKFRVVITHRIPRSSTDPTSPINSQAPADHSLNMFRFCITCCAGSSPAKRYFQRKWTKRRPKFFESFSTRW